MRGYVVSTGGTFGTVERSYVTGDGIPCVVISWGPRGWLTPVTVSDCKQLGSRFESEARAEAIEWLRAKRGSGGT